MSHECEAALITCEDFRLHQRKDGRNYVAEFIKSRNQDCDLITRGGGILDLVQPEDMVYIDCLMRDIQVSTRLHQARVIYLMNHEDCGAYSRMVFSSKEEERERHYRDLQRAQQRMGEFFPGTEIKLYFAYLIKRPDIFEIRSI